jgi:tRNA A-37 threonylcarbamoyl transferase component Bud32
MTRADRPDDDHGRLVGGRYRLEELIGRGGMASVHRAIDLRLGRRVAVKMLRPKVLADPDLAMRFRREAHAATVLRHPNVVACLDTGTDDGRPYLVMEIVDGEDLASLLRRERRLPWERAVRIAGDVAIGLGVAHGRGFVHRDVKPGNILLARDGRARITDFGIARLDAEAEASLPGTTLGSVHYFSPEQAQGATTTPASDVYGLGLVLFEALTGARPFGGGSPEAIASARVGAPAPSPRTLEPGIPVWVDAIVRRALAPRPADRYPNGAALAAALDGGVVDVPGPTAGRALAPGGGRRRRTSGIAATAVAAVAVALVVFGGAPSADGPAVRTPAATAPAVVGATPTPVAVGVVSDLCEPLPGGLCPVSAGVYEPTTFRPGLSFTLTDGWSVARAYDDAIVLRRPEGYVTIARDVRVLVRGEPRRVPADRLLSHLAAHEDLRVVARDRAVFAGRSAALVDVVPAGRDRVPVFLTSEDTFSVELGTVTRFVAGDIDGDAVLLVLEGADGHVLEDVVIEAGSLLATLGGR